MMDRDKAYEYLQRRIDPDGSFDNLLVFPKYLEIETINGCNARCSMCTINDWNSLKTRTIDDNLFAKLADEVCTHANQIKRVGLFRDGEPLLDRKLCTRIRRLKRGGIQQVAVSTNVSLLNETKGQELLDAGIDLVMMSIDSLQKTVYERIRRGLHFETVMDNAMRFIELRNRISPETRIWMRMVRQKENCDEWETYLDFWQKVLHPLDRIYYHNIFNWGGQLKEQLPIAPSYEPYLPCVSLWSLLVISVTGEAQLCNVDYRKKYPLGDLNTSTIEEIWTSRKLRSYRERHLNDDKQSLDICRICNVWDEPEGKSMISADYAEKVDLEGNKSKRKTE